MYIIICISHSLNEYWLQYNTITLYCPPQLHYSLFTNNSSPNSPGPGSLRCPRPAPPHDIFLKSSVRTFQLIRSRLVLTNKTSFLTICIVGFLHTTTHPHIYYPSTEFFWAYIALSSALSLQKHQLVGEFQIVYNSKFDSQLLQRWLWAGTKEFN